VTATADRGTGDVPATVSYGRRLLDLATDPATAPMPVTIVRSDGSAESRSVGDLCRSAWGIATRLQEGYGVAPDALVPNVLRTSLEHVEATMAAWLCGAGVIPVNPRLPDAELDGLLGLITPPVVFEEEARPASGPNTITRATLTAWSDPTTAIPNGVEVPVPDSAIVFTSGGSSGRPKLIDSFGPGETTPGETLGVVGKAMQRRPAERTLVCNPLYHSSAFASAYVSILDGLEVYVLERFDAELTLRSLERFRIQSLLAVPTMMLRMVRSDAFAEVDLSSVERLTHTGGPCPAWVTQAWIDKIGAERVFNLYGASENIGHCLIRGDESLRRVGSVGRPLNCEIRILDEDGRDLPQGEVGIVYTRRTDDPVRDMRYIGAELFGETADGYRSVGDMGWLDDDGYLYLADRADDLVITGGANVFPQEVEGALGSHPDVVDVCVVGLPDDELGQRVHAVVVPRPGSTASPEDLRDHVRRQLAGYKVPKTIELVDELPRTDVGKIRRKDLRAARTPA
jgi:bile acid-coenzyme A ligase